MFKSVVGYLYLSRTVVLNKSDIKNNPPDENFREVSLFINEKDIREWAKELDIIEDPYEK